jgi:hypothetical protein
VRATESSGRGVMSSATCVISGSFRRYYEEICEVITAFESHGIRVVSPARSVIVNPGAEFVLFADDHTSNVSEVEQAHLAKIAKADFVYCYNPNGYVGINTTFELGFAYAHGVPVIALAYTRNPGLDCFLSEVSSPQDVMRQYALLCDARNRKEFIPHRECMTVKSTIHNGRADLKKLSLGRCPTEVL